MAQDAPPSGSVYLVGGGGHGRVVLDAALEAGLAITAIVDPGLPIGHDLWGIRVIGGDDVLAAAAPGSGWLNGIGANPRIAARRLVFEQMRGQFHPVILRHPSATISKHTRLDPGVQVMAGAVVQSGCTIGENCVVNTGARIDHDCVIARHCFIAPGATLCGEVMLGEASFVGAGAVILPGLRVGSGAIIGAGAVVIADVPEGARVAGNPALPMKEKNHG